MRYRKVSTRIWADDRFMRLSTPQPNAQSLFLYLLTGPHTTSIPGVIVAGEASLAESLNWPIEGFRKAFRELLSEGLDEGHENPLVMVDPRARLIFLPRAVNHNQPENPNVVKSWKVQWSEVPECELKALVWDVLLAGLSSKSKALAEEFKASIEKPKGFGKPFAKPSMKPIDNPTPKTMANQEQEQEQEQDNNLALFASAPIAATEEKAPRGRPPKDTPEIVVDRERWLTGARALVGLTPEQTPPSKQLFIRFAQQRKARGIDQLMRALDGLENDSWAKSLGLQSLLSDALIEKGLAAGNKRARNVGIGFDDAWDAYAKEAGLVKQ